MTSARLLVLGGAGQLGHELCRALAPLGEVVAPPREAFDLGHPDTLAALVDAARPALIVNAAAYTAVDRAESETELAMTVNARAVAALAESAARYRIPLVHYSTDYVFDGRASAPYSEQAPTAPLNAYGHSKLAGEQALLASDAPYLLLRTSWVYAARGQNFLRTVLRLAREHPSLRIVDDQHGAPTWACTLADVTALVVYRLGFDAAAWLPHRGVYHVTNAGETTWCGFARAILARAADWPDIRAREVVAIATEDYPTPAARPRYSVLDSGKLRDTFNLAPEPWESALERCMAALETR
jgi:dTDP-4-dehydrorhamnose reductase